MADLPKGSVVSSRGVKNDLKIALGLILLGLLVFVAYLFPASSWFQTTKSFLPLIVFLVFVIVVLGFLLIWRIIGPVMKLSYEARSIAQGDFNREVKIFRDDEIGQLGEAFNQMTRRMKENLEELRSFSQKTEAINVEINKKIQTFSNLLRISHLIAQNAPFKELVQFALTKCLSPERMSCIGLVLKNFQTNEYQLYYIGGDNSLQLLQQGVKNIKIIPGEGFLGRAILKPNGLTVDRDTPSANDMKELQKTFLINNILAFPLVAQEQIHGLLFGGNNKHDFVFDAAEKDLLLLTAQQIAIAVYMERLKLQLEDSAVLDPLTGLLARHSFEGRFNEEIKRSLNFKRPCTLVLIAVGNMELYSKTLGQMAVENLLIKIANILKENLGQLEQAAYCQKGEFAMLFPEKDRSMITDAIIKIEEKIQTIWPQPSGPNDGCEINYASAIVSVPNDADNAEILQSKARKILQEKLAAI